MCKASFLLHQGSSAQRELKSLWLEIRFSCNVKYLLRANLSFIRAAFCSPMFIYEDTFDASHQREHTRISFRIFLLFSRKFIKEETGGALKAAHADAPPYECVSIREWSRCAILAILRCCPCDLMPNYISG